MGPFSKEYHLVKDFDRPEDELVYPRRARHDLFSKLNWQSLILILSILTNLFLGFYTLTLIAALKTRGRSKYAGLEVSERNLFHAGTEYSDKNETYADLMWEAIDTDPGAITLSYDYARDNDLLEPNPFPWDDSRGLFYIRGFHDLHCLKLIKRSLSEYRLNMAQSRTRQHISHCVDTLRQSVMCSADDTPMPTVRDRATGDGQAMQCRSWTKLVDWAKDPEKTACYKVVDEYKEPVHNLERFVYCPPDSPYYEIMTKYFEKWGHKDLFDE